MNTSSKDNIYPIGTFVTAKVNPSLPLVIHQYYQRIYYCAVVNDPAHKQFAYFERELNQS
jgi:hypothetical protein